MQWKEGIASEALDSYISFDSAPCLLFCGSSKQECPSLCA